MSWFFKTYRSTEQGWFQYRTPDGCAIIDQDAFFHQALETIARKLNEIISHERSKAVAKAKQPKRGR